MCGKADIRTFPLLAGASRAFAHATGGFKGAGHNMAESARSSIFGTPGGRHRRQLVFSERILGSAPLRAAVTVFAVVVAGLTTPMLNAQADETTPPAVASVSYLVTFAAGTSDADQAAALADAGAVDVDAIPQLRMHAVS